MHPEERSRRERGHDRQRRTRRPRPTASGRPGRSRRSRRPPRPRAPPCRRLPAARVPGEAGERVGLRHLDPVEDAEQLRVLAQPGEAEAGPGDDHGDRGGDERPGERSEAPGRGKPDDERPEEELGDDGQAHDRPEPPGAVTVVPGGGDPEQEERPQGALREGEEADRCEDRDRVAATVANAEEAEREHGGGEAEQEEGDVAEDARQQRDGNECEGIDRRVHELVVQDEQPRFRRPVERVAVHDGERAGAQPAEILQVPAALDREEEQREENDRGCLDEDPDPHRFPPGEGRDPVEARRRVPTGSDAGQNAESLVHSTRTGAPRQGPQPTNHTRNVRTREPEDKSSPKTSTSGQDHVRRTFSRRRRTATAPAPRAVGAGMRSAQGEESATTRLGACS